jgi:signal transduction histidine kinase
MDAASVGRGSAVLRHDERSAGLRDRRRVVAVAASGLALAAWTALIPVVPFLSFTLRAPDAAVAIQTTGAVVCALVAALAYLRYSLTRRRTFVFVAVAFTLLAANQFVFGIVFRAGSAEIGTNAYPWLLGRLVTAAFLVVGALRPLDRSSDGSTLGGYVRVLAVGVTVLVGGQAAILAASDALPPLVEGPVRLARVTGVLPGITAADVLLGLIGASAFVVAAILYLRIDVGPFSAWLPPALVFAAVSHVHYMLMPTIFSGRISTGDLLRVAFASTLLVGLMVDVRATYLAERRRRIELDAAYRAEVERVGELEEADRGRAELMSLLTHELLHPVAAIRSSVLVLMRRWEALDDARRRQIVERVEGQTRQLVELAERVPTAGRLDRSAFTIRPQGREVAQVVDEAIPPSLDRPLEVSIDEDVGTVVVDVDPVRIAQVFGNLLSNADKFSPPRSPIRITAARDGDKVRFSVADAGSGVDLAEADSLFEPFKRGANVDGQVPGSGLGLYVARGIVDAHGGDIWVERAEAGGAVFSFTLPCRDDRP